MSQLTKLGNTLENLFAHGWGLVLLAIATILGGIAAVDYFCDGCIKNPNSENVVVFVIVIIVILAILIATMLAIIAHLPYPKTSSSKEISSDTVSPSEPDDEVQELHSTPSIVLLYKPDLPLDDSAAQVLQSFLTQAGHTVFLDRHTPADQLQTVLQHAQAVLILLTQEASYSDLLEAKVEQTHQVINDCTGPKPPIISIRLQFQDEIPLTHLAELLINRPAIVWNDIQDTSPLRQELMPHLTQTLPDMTSGAISLTSPFYLKRHQDDELQQAIAGHHSIILLRGSRQVGKTSLLVRGLQMARDNGMQVWVTDFQSFGDSAFTDLKTFYATLAQDLAAQSSVAVPKRFWDDKLVPNRNFEDYLCKHLLPQVTQPVLWAIDEADRLLQQNFSGDVFGLLRSWHNKRASQPEQATSRITLLIAYATEYHLFIRDAMQSPFNVGTKLTLEDFTETQLADLNQRYGSPLRPEELREFHHLTGGHPYLSRCGLHEMVYNHLTFPQFRQRTQLSEEGIFIDHLRRIVTVLDQNLPLRDALRAILRNQLPFQETLRATLRGQLPLREALQVILRSPVNLDEPAFDRLRSGGILKGVRHDFQLRCELYASYLKKKLL